MATVLAIVEPLAGGPQRKIDLGDQIGGGGEAATDELQFRASEHAQLGRIRLLSPLEIDDVLVGDQTAFRWRPTFTHTAAFIGGMIIASPDVTVEHGTSIPTLLGDNSVFRQNIAPGFAAYTFSNVLPVIQNLGNFNVLQALCFNIGVTQARITAGTSTTNNTTGMSFSPQIRASINGAVMTRTVGVTAVRCGPTHSTVAGATVNYGIVRALHCLSPAVALFQPQTGTENLTAYYGIDFENITFASSGDKVVIRSAMTDAANRFFLQNNGGARSDLGGGDLLDVGLLELPGDTTGESILLGAGGDARIHFDGTNLVLNPVVVPSGASVFIPGKLHVQSSVFPAWLVERTAAATVGVLSGFRQLATSTGNMADTFGAAVFWSIQDIAAVINNIGYDSCVRFGGADNTGQFRKYVYLAGVATEISRIDTLQTYVMLNGGTFRTGGGRLKPITRIAAGPYTLLASDHVLFVDTDAGAVVVNLPAGVANTEYRIVNVGSGGNNITLTPNGAELLFGAAAASAIADGGEARVGYEATEGWF